MSASTDSKPVDDQEEETPSELDLESVLVSTVLKLEEIDVNLYRSTHLWKPAGGRGVFGGQVVGQALVAAGHTRMNSDVHVHSLHCYFVRPGIPEKPILYHVERTRDGISFCTRTVKATQNGEAILGMMVSYHKPEPSQLLYQYPFPKVAPPEELRSFDDLIKIAISNFGDLLSDKQAQILKRVSAAAMEMPVDVKPVEQDFIPRFYGKPREPKSLFWVRARGHIGTNNNLHRCALAYISDMSLLSTALNPFPRFRVSMMASLDHSMWFHTLFRADEWMLYECEGPRSVGARALALGRFWKRDGTLAVSVAQEGVARGELVPPKDKSKL